MKILVVEDDRNLCSFVEKGLREEGYAVDVAYDGEDAIVKAFVYDYDLIVLDLMLPGKNGYEVTAHLRREGRTVPILVLTARDAKEDLVRGLDLGADDYLTKPFSFDELLARIRALLRRGGAKRSEFLQYRDVKVDRLEHKAWRGDRELVLTPKEFQILEHFLLKPGEVVTRTELLEKVWDRLSEPDSNVVDVHIRHLRRKLTEGGEPQIIETVRGVGFMLS
jgi:DNA-binding response OmpR family regulator